MIEVWSANVQDGGTYAIKLPAGTYTVVASTNGKPTFEATGVARDRERDHDAAHRVLRGL
ncbi:MAG: hypothetical protein MZW92_03320 [Comamonadaceae bacterium]|nr:hypothetical protein [Comamonadaceae bacterium]